MIAVVTAAGDASSGGGLGPAVCRALDACGYSVIGWDADAEALVRTAAGATLHASEVVDVADPDAVTRAFSNLDESPALVVNRLVSAGGGRRFAPFHEMTPYEVEAQAAVDLVGPSVVCLIAIQRMTGAGRGAIVNVTSANASYPAPGRLVEGAAAAAIESLTTTLGAELAASGIRVNAVAMAPATPEGALGGRPRSAGPPPSHEELAALIAWLGSPESSALCGAVMRADRGFDPFPGLDRRAQGSTVEVAG